MSLERSGMSRDRVSYLRRLRDGFADGSADRAQADKVLANSEVTHQMVERFCHYMRGKVNSRGVARRKKRPVSSRSVHEVYSAEGLLHQLRQREPPIMRMPDKCLIRVKAA